VERTTENQITRLDAAAAIRVPTRARFVTPTPSLRVDPIFTAEKRAGESYEDVEESGFRFLLDFRFRRFRFRFSNFSV
jgi:hypothetical protein